MYVIIRTDQGGGYVSEPGSTGSYTHNLRRARVFSTREAAERECCPGNERPVTIDSQLSNRGR